ncbi:phosphotransferase [Corynebacterium macginleyi]|uniref:Phosphotransferase n=1 Tax=Corynebacterium macginleyi TaxID=38290 RepID=A0ABS1Y5U5_9CORY|nr:phosphotransferase [Corynebacterium macginleyi]MBK4136921.1 phosphotransferase [Corynebacterium macginleyi]MBK4150079.1 phosphotransferase [Corynebacterium macginleyi]MBK4166975.1 phosphotransferase [Corynebacterium macginleyi]MBK4173293.1 phosphotransferase [Corynebacterium macginleyi]MBK4179143.1 phosphotransferase [Corynebacterium macginleyi]
MDDTQTLLSADEVIDAASEMLSRRFGGTPEMSGVEDLGGSGNALVLRAKVAPSAFLPHRSVVIKYNPVTGYGVDDAAMLREVVAYQFTTALAEDVRPGPVLLAHDLDRRILVLTDLGQAETLADVLLESSDEDRIRILRSLGTALGRIHGGTADHEQNFETLLKRTLRHNPEFAEHQSVRDQSLYRSISIGLDLLDEAGLEAPESFRSLANQAAESLASGKDRAFTPFDLSPDNIIVSKRLHFLDYEWAGFRNVGFDVACVIAGFPQFLFSKPITDKEAETFLAAWSREVSGVWPRFADANELHDLVVACLIGWALSSVTTMHAGGIEGVVALASGDAEVVHDPQRSILRPPDSGLFTEDELLVRRDLYETFEALARYAAQCGTAPCMSIAEFGTAVARRVCDE